MKSSLDTQWNEIQAAHAQTEANAQQAQLAGQFLIHEEWSLHRTQFDDTPYVKFTCPGCKQILTTTKLALSVQHCGDVSTMPEEISAKLETLQIKKGLRKAKTFVERILGKPATPNLNAF